jgi:hypothetical protein
MIETSTLNLFGAMVIIVTAALVLAVPRRYVPLPFIIAICYLTLGQQVTLFGFNFFPVRILIAAGWIRLFVRGEFKQLHFNILDRIILAWLVAKFTINIILYQNQEAFISQSGFLYNAIGLYFLFRCSVRNLDDIKALFKVSALAIFPLAVIMIFEEITARNIFSSLGGVPEFSEIRSGRARCQGPFRHPILAGSFGAAMMPLAFALWKQKGEKLTSIIGFCSATLITLTAGSSGPLMAYISGLAGFALWSYRRYMKLVRWGVVGVILALAAVMKAPFYYIIERVGSVTGGSGWYRAYLIDQTVKHFDEWWLMGTKESARWMPFHLTINDKEFADITSEYIAQAVNGGLLSLVLFILIIVFAYKIIGKALKDHPASEQYIVWVLGVTLFVHIMSFISVSYYDQIIVIWYLLLAMIASLSQEHTGAAANG